MFFKTLRPKFFGQTVVDDLAFGPANLGFKGQERRKATIADALALAHLEGMADRSPRTLSGGEKRRLAIAGVLAMKSPCIILDEPFANLDYPSVQEILDVLHTLHVQARTLIVITHEIEKVLHLATRLVILANGVITFDGHPDESTKDYLPQCRVSVPISESLSMAYRRNRSQVTNPFAYEPGASWLARVHPLIKFACLLATTSITLRIGLWPLVGFLR